MGLVMEYSHNFNPEGKTEIKEEAYLDIVGRFPKIGKSKTMGIDIVESWVDNDNPDGKYGPQRRIGKVILTDQTVEMRKEDYYGDPDERRWTFSMSLNEGYGEIDKPTTITGTIEKYYFQKYSRSPKGYGRTTGSEASGWKYRFEIMQLIYGSANVETANWKFPAYLTRNISNQYKTLRNIVEAANLSIETHKKPIKHKIGANYQDEEPKTKRNIPLIAGISAGLASIWYFFTK
jgi:hypothetical protein